MDGGELESILHELFGDRELPEFSRKWMMEVNISREHIREMYHYVRQIGIEDDKLLSVAHILARDKSRVEKSRRLLNEFGISDQRIATKPELLNLKPDVLRQKYDYLTELGVSRKKIASQPMILGLKREQIDKKYALLTSLGFSHAKIMLQPQLMAKKDTALLDNYRAALEYVSLDVLVQRPEFLTLSPRRLESNHRYLQSLGLSAEKNRGPCKSTR